MLFPFLNGNFRTLERLKLGEASPIFFFR
uniref:Uncharacterized protein n=1 Tax=Anguilla anguilla TaxID=7936 RepID=A0A0E9P980_ANGAN